MPPVEMDEGTLKGLEVSAVFLAFQQNRYRSLGAALTDQIQLGVIASQTIHKALQNPQGRTVPEVHSMTLARGRSFHLPEMLAVLVDL
jgi:hypothetical protein